jgi:hypothetical protein
LHAALQPLWLLLPLLLLLRLHQLIIAAGMLRDIKGVHTIACVTSQQPAPCVVVCHTRDAVAGSQQACCVAATTHG